MDIKARVQLKRDARRKGKELGHELTTFRRVTEDTSSRLYGMQWSECKKCSALIWLEESESEAEVYGSALSIKCGILKRGE